MFSSPSFYFLNWAVGDIFAIVLFVYNKASRSFGAALKRIRIFKAIIDDNTRGTLFIYNSVRGLPYLGAFSLKGRRRL